jgi:hypothetical protein
LALVSAVNQQTTVKVPTALQSPVVVASTQGIRSWEIAVAIFHSRPSPEAEMLSTVTRS